MNAQGHRRGLTVEDYAALVRLTPQAAAAKLGVSPASVYGMERKHGLRFARNAPRRAAGVAVAPDVEATEAEAPPTAVPTDGAMIAAPAWSPERDGLILASKGRYAQLAALADQWRLPVKRVEARWHVLRAAR